MKMLSPFLSAAYIQAHFRQDCFMNGKNMKPYQSDLGPYCLQNRLPKYISRRGADNKNQDWQTKG